MNPNDVTVCRETINGVGCIGFDTIAVGVDAAHTDREGKQFGAIGYIDGGDGLTLDAAGLRRLAAACMDAADELDRLTNEG